MRQVKKSKSSAAAELEQKSHSKEDPSSIDIVSKEGKKAKKRKSEQTKSEEINVAAIETATDNLSVEENQSAEKPVAKKVRKQRTGKVLKSDQTSEVPPVTAVAVNEVDDSKKKSKRKKKKKNMPEVIPKDQELMKAKCTSYLEEWKENRSEWKFQKLVQVWLVQNMLDDSRVPDSVFPLFLEYISGAKGNTVKIITEKAAKVLEEAEKGDADLDDPKLLRARNVIQILVVD